MKLLVSAIKYMSGKFKLVSGRTKGAFRDIEEATLVSPPTCSYDMSRSQRREIEEARGAQEGYLPSTVHLNI